MFTTDVRGADLAAARLRGNGGMILWLRRTIGFVGLVWAAASAAGLTIATYNLENYTLADRMVDGVYRTRYPKPEEERRAISAVVRAIAPDVLAVQEMGRADYLEEFRAELRAAGQNYPHAVLLEAADPDRHVAVLSKLPFKAVQRHATVPTKFRGGTDWVKRGVLEVTFATTAGDFSLFVVHLKSKRTEGPDDPESARQRAAEAEAVRDLVLARCPDPRSARFLICGDWNDTRAARPVRAMQKRGLTDIGNLVPATDSRGEVWTHHYRREDVYQRIDYFLVSPALRPWIAGGRGKIYDGNSATTGSDHRAVYLEITPPAIP